VRSNAPESLYYERNAKDGQRTDMESPGLIRAPQALADEPAKDAVGPREIAATECDAVAVAEIELCQIAVQVLLAAVLVNAPHAALEDRKEAPLNRVRVDAATGTRPVWGRVSAGFGLWGGAQPGAYRVDAGPRISLRLRDSI
jgi:hypothetical protein